MFQRNRLIAAVGCLLIAICSGCFKSADDLQDEGNVLFLEGNFEGAIEKYDLAIQREPDTGWLYSSRAKAYFFSGEYAEAKADFDHAIFLSPQDRFIRSNRAMFLATCEDAAYRDGRQAVQDAKIACQIAGEHASLFYSTLAAACAETGDFDSAVKWQQKYVDRDLAIYQIDRDQLRDYHARKPMRSHPKAKSK